MAFPFTILPMHGPTCKLALAITLALTLAGCDSLYPAVKLAADSGTSPRLSYADLGEVLDGLLTDDGLLFPEVLKRRSDILDRQLRLMTVMGPQTSPEQLASDDDVLAYWYNARAAWAMKLTLVCNCPLRLSKGELIDRRFQIDGREMTLTEIDAQVASLGDWRVTAAAPGVTLARARLPQKPFSGKDVRARVSQRVRQLLDDDKRFVIDVDHKTVVVPRVIWECRETILSEYESAYGAENATLTTALLPHAGPAGQRRLHDAVGYDVAPADASLPTAILEDAWKIKL